MNLFEGKRIRSRLDGRTNKRWFSVVDVCAVMNGSDYQQARSYWKWLKSKLAKQKNEMESVCCQLKFEAADGKMRRTDVMDAEGIIDLIKAWPKGRGDAVRLWLFSQIENGEDAARLISEAAAKVGCRAGNLLYTVTRKVIYDAKIHGQQCSVINFLSVPKARCCGSFNVIEHGFYGYCGFTRINLEKSA